MERDKTKAAIDKIIKDIQVNHNNKQRKEIMEKISEYYAEGSNYTEIDLLKRKEFLLFQEKPGLEIFFNYFMQISISALTSLCTVRFTIFFLSEQPISETVHQINELALSGNVIMLVLITLIVIVGICSIIQSFRGRQYRKYRIIEFELSIINALLQKYYGSISRQIIDKLSHQQAGSQANSQSSLQSNNPNDSVHPNNP